MGGTGIIAPWDSVLGTTASHSRALCGSLPRVILAISLRCKTCGDKLGHMRETHQHHVSNDCCCYRSNDALLHAPTPSMTVTVGLRLPGELLQKRLQPSSLGLFMFGGSDLNDLLSPNVIRHLLELIQDVCLL